jgi:hypothetical protein
MLHFSLGILCVRDYNEAPPHPRSKSPTRHSRYGDGALPGMRSLWQAMLFDK